MELILANADGEEIRYLDYTKADFDIGGENTFEIIMSVDDWQGDIEKNYRVYINGTEIGGLVGEIETNSTDETVTIRGYTWRGLLSKKIIEPPSGSDYFTYTGTRPYAVRSAFNSLDWGDLFTYVVTSSGSSVTTKFDRYTDFLSGATKVLGKINQRLYIHYEKDDNVCYVENVDIVDYSDEIEVSQDSNVQFTINFKYNCTNHLIALGEGELADREVLHLYVDKNGNIGTTQYYTGINEICEVYDASSSEDLEEDATEYFEDLITPYTLTASIAELDVDIQIGDLVGATDAITGISATKALAQIIYTDDGTETVEYNFEEEE